MKPILPILAAALLLGCDGSDKTSRELRVPSNGEVLTAVKIEDKTDYSESENKIYDQFEELLPSLTPENLIVRGAYKDLPVTWWAGTADFNIQNWVVTTDRKQIWITAYQRQSDPSRVVVNVYDENVEPSDFYGIIMQR